MRKRLDKLRRLAMESETRMGDESAGQQLSPEEQERASLKRIMSEMGHNSGRKRGRAPNLSNSAPGQQRRGPNRKGPRPKKAR